MRRILHPALVLASAVAVATCADAPTGPRNARNGSLLRGHVAVATQLSASASATATRLGQFGFAIDNIGITLRRVVGGAVVLDTTIIVTPGQTLSLALPVTVTTVDEQFIARVVMRQGTTVLYSGEHTVRATLDGSSAPPPPVVIEVEYSGPGASATSIRITPRDSVFPTTARPRFDVTATDASGAAVPDVPVVWSTSDTAMATVDATTGVVTPGARRGAVTLRALALSGLTDTLPLSLLSPASSVAAVSGDGQTGTAGQSLAAPLVVQVLAADGLPAAGETVAFAATGAGTITPASAISDANGRASATIVLGAQLGEQRFTATVASLTPVTATQHAVAGAAASVVPATADTLRGVVGQPLSAPLGVHVRDAHGLPVSAATVRWSISGAGGALASDTSATSADGSASVNFTFGSAAGASVVTAAVGELTASFALVASHDAPSQLVVVSGDGQQAPPSTALAPFFVRLADQHGNPVGGHAVAWSRTQGSGALAAATSTTGADGTASVGYTTGAEAGTERVTAAAAGFEAVFTATTAAGSPALLQRVAGDSQTVVAGTTIPVRLKARATDASGNGVAALVDIVVTAPDATTQAETGIATDSAGYVLVPLSLLERPRLAGGYSAVVKLQAAPATQAGFTLTVIPAPAAALALLAAPTTATSGVPLSPQPSLQLVDSLGNASPTASVAITASVADSALLGGTVTIATDSTGRAAYTDLAIDGSGLVTLSFGAEGLTGISHGVTVEAAPVPEPAPAARIDVVAGDSQTVVAGTIIPTGMKARVVDSTGAGVAALVDIVVTAPDATTQAETGVATDSAGYVLVPLSLLERPRLAGGYSAVVKLQAAPATQAAFTLTVVPAPAAALALLAAPATATSGVPLSPQPSLQLVDSLGNASPTASVAITASVADSALLGGTVTIATDSTGRAAYTDLAIDGSGLVTLSFGAEGLTGISHGVTVEAAPAGQPALVVSLHTASQVRISQFHGAVGGLGVIVRDTTNTPVSGIPVHFILASDGSHGSFADTGFEVVTLTDSTGVATFQDWAPPSTAGSYTLTAQARVDSVDVGAPITFTAVRSNWTYALTASPASPVAGDTTQVSAALVDGAGVGVGEAGRVVTWTSSATLAAATSVTDSAGIARVTLTTSRTPATVTASATDTAGVAGSIEFASRSAGGSVSVTPQHDTLTSLGDQRQLAASLVDSAGAPMAGTFTWTSRNPSAVSVDTSGLATAVANGSAYIVASEIGGASDSALVVVQQRVASVMVTPGTLTLRLTGRQQFTAAAVDGRGHPIGSPVFSWASTSPSVASVDSAGAVEALSLGTTEVRATTSGVTGVGALTVVTPITRIAVTGVDGAGAPIDAGTPLTSLGASRRFIAVAYDTLDQPMSGVSFAWTSSNPSVAQLDSIAAASVYARAAANGSTSIRATVHGVVGSAPLSVEQALAGIELTPVSATIGVNGTVGMIARGVDANGYFISTGNFAYSSSTPSVATVGSTTGIVTGVALGNTTITATSGSVTSNGAVVTVSESVPPAISFGRDTLSVGRGSSTSIPVFLSTPHSSPVTVQLSVADTFAYFNPATITFSAGQTALNATLVGRNAGTTRAHAVDASSTGFAGDTAALTVRATLKLAATGYSMNATDSRATQVLLSDPSPAGGTYVTFTFGTPGIASASPNPAFIPEGQLAADVVITGTLTGSTSATTTMVPSAPGVSGTSSNVTVYPASIMLSTSTIRMGAGQYRDDTYAYVHTNQSTPLTLTLTSSDTAVAGVPQTITIPANSNYAYFRTSARTPGNVTVAVAAPGWNSPTPMAVRSTTPRVTTCCGASLTTTAPERSITVYSTDSTGSASKRTNSLVVRLISRDTSIIKVLDSTVTIAAGLYYNNAGRIIPAGGTGSTYLRVEAGGHEPADSVLFTVTGPQLQWSASSGRLGAGQVATNHYIYTPHNVTEPLELTITSSDTTIVAPTTVATIPSGTNYRYIDIRGQSPGTATLTVSAPGYSPASMTYVVTTPSIVLSGGGTVNNFAPSRSMTVYSTDSVGSAHNRQASLTVSLVSSDTTVIKVDSAGTIAAGTYYTSAPRATIVGIGTAQVIAMADGHRPDTVAYTVVEPQVQFNTASYTLGATQTREFYVFTPDSRTSEVTVTFTQVNGAVLSVPAGTTIAANTNYRYFAVNALSVGVDTIIASAAGYRPDTLVVRVTTPRLTASTLPSGRTTTSPPFYVTIYAADSLGTVHNVTDSIVVEIASSDTTVIRPASRYATIVPGSYYVQPTIDIVGPGSASLTYTDTSGRYVPHTTAPMTVTGPSLAMSQSSYSIGMGQTTGPSGVYVYVPNAVADSLVVTLTSTSTRVATVPATVTIPAGLSYAYFQVTAGDTVGTIQVQATATGYTATAMSVQVNVPKFVVSTSGSAYTTTSPRSITVYATDANGNTRHVRDNLTVTLTSSAPGVAAIDQATVTINAGAYYSNSARWTPGTVGTARITASDERAVYQRYTPAHADVSVTLPPMYLSSVPSALGIGQYTTGAYVSTADVQQDSVTVTLSHSAGARTSTPSTVTIPASSYYAYFRVTALASGPDTITASIATPAHSPVSAVTVVGAGRIDPVSNWPSTLAVGDSVAITIYARDPNQNARNLVAATTWSLSHNANIEFRQGGAAITSVTIPADGDRVTLYVKALAAGTGTAGIAATNYSTYNNSISVVSP